MHLSGLYVYPIKSAAGIPLAESGIDDRGLRYDRRWMLVDDSGRFISQRGLPRLALVRVALEPEGLLVEAPGMPPLTVPYEVQGGLSEAEVWGDRVGVVPVGGYTDEWFTGFLGARCSLVQLPQASIRPVDPEYGGAGDTVGLADGFPFLLVSEASLEDLNSRLTEPLPMNRFRPNLVVGGSEPFAEDGWESVTIGEVRFRVAKPCSRCKITTVEQSTGVVAGAEPLRTLAEYRKSDRKSGGKVLFGQNLIHDRTGRLRVGDRVAEVFRSPGRDTQVI